MSAEIYNILMIVSFALSAVFLLVAIILFFKLKIKKAVDELSGKNYKKQVASIRKENTDKKAGGYIPDIFKDRNDKTTSSLSMDLSRRLKRATSQLSVEDQIPDKPDDWDSSGGTVLLNDVSNEVGWEEGTSVLGASDDYDGTTLLAEDDEGTTLLSDETQKEDSGKKCTVIREITVFESKEFLSVN